MSTITLPTLNRISRERLASLLLATPPPTAQKLVILDVRDSDHIGGHIKSSRHVPADSFSYAAPELARTLKDAEKVVVHCALSQQRGPSAALKYLRERERLYGSESIRKADLSSTSSAPADGKQEVYVLDGGFVKWQEKYGEDERLTEDYNKELWANGY